jgi:hypothetical protein
VGEQTVLLFSAALNVVMTVAVLFVPGVKELRSPQRPDPVPAGRDGRGG